MITPHQQPVARPTRSVEPTPVKPGMQQPPPSSKLLSFLGPLWREESRLPLQKRLLLKRLITILILFTLARWCKNSAISTARWPEPIKYGGVALFLLAVGLFLWGILIIWKVLQQLRLRGLLILLGIGYLLLTGALILTSDSSLPPHQEALLITKRLTVATGHKLRDAFQTIVKAPEEFRFAYTGHRRPLQLSSTDPEDTSYLTPIPANRPVQLWPTTQPIAPSTSTPAVDQERTPSPSASATSASSLLPSNCPHPQARLISPQMNQVIRDAIQVEGTANIENFGYYKFEIRREDGDVEDEWHWIESFEIPVEEGILGTWQVSHLPEGVYTLRLMVVDHEGNYPFPPCDVRVSVIH